MIQALESAWRQLNDPARFGGVFEQFPVTAAALGLLLVLALLCTGGQSHALRFTGVVVFGLGAALAAWQRGASAEDEPAWQGHLGWISLAVPASLLLISATPTVAVRLVAVVLALALAVAGSGVVGYTMAELSPANGLPSIDEVESEDPADLPPGEAPPSDPPPPQDDGQAPAGDEENIFEFGRE
jgi:hypothetical protein